MVCALTGHILITGASGQLGDALRKLAEARGLGAVSVSRPMRVLPKQILGW
jgi:dTDP-4-dehydrorhamnose reductase